MENDYGKQLYCNQISFEGQIVVRKNNCMKNDCTDTIL